MTIELRLFSESLRWRKRFEDSNPDVGMGPSYEILLHEICDSVGAELTIAEKEMVVSAARYRNRNGFWPDGY